YGDSFVIADIPGIIEGASQGIGLGIQFLRHIERTRLLLHVIDVSGIEGRNPVQDFNTINEELKQYSEKLSQRKQIIVANKVDSMQDENLYQELEKMAKEKGLEIYKISAATKQGIKELMIRVAEVLRTLPKEDLVEIQKEEKVYTLQEEEEISVKKEEGVYIVSGIAVEKLMRTVNLADNESLHYFHRRLNEMGINQRLRELGIKDGDWVQISDYELEWED
ncbi:MAG: Obg family GTPase CgtA, partial [Bacilli bacterium]|nr:Obg family GTPase CgtA [Bacilli bacterium]